MKKPAWPAKPEWINKYQTKGVEISWLILFLIVYDSYIFII